MSSEVWQPLLHDADAARARAAIDRVARALRAPDPAWQVGASLANGDAGLAVFYGYLGETDVAARCIERAIEALASSPMPLGLHVGFTGVAWATEHLIGRVIERGDEDEDVNADIDTALLEALAHDGDGDGDDSDLLTGSVGIGVYALERWPRPAARALLEQVVARLADSAHRSAAGTYWLAPRSVLDADTIARFPHGVVNLGLAHGVPGAIALLAACADAGVAAVTAGDLLADAVRWLRACALTDARAGRFPDLASPGPAPIRRARHAWCYGDVSIATALVLAGDRAGRADWSEAGLELARESTTRADDTTGVRDACLCHGAAGLGLMYARLARRPGGADPVLETAAARWFRAALDFEQADSVVGGFAPVVHVRDVPLGLTSVGLLTGAAGVALALHAAIGERAPDWDRALLLSLERGGAAGMASPSR